MSSPRPAEAQARPRAQAPPSALDRWLLRRALDALGHPPFTLLLWNGERIEGRPGEPSRVRLHLRDRALVWQIAKAPSLAFGEAYVDGRLELDGDLVSAIELAFDASYQSAPWARALAKVFSWSPRYNTVQRARRNVHHHYDLGNDFYRLWLDEHLLYTCAYFAHPELSLEEAQVAKMEHVCRKLRLREGEEVVEAGCGWGALALHMAERHGVKVRAFNVSTEQIRHAREEARRRGLAGRVEFVEDDWRNIAAASTCSYRWACSSTWAARTTAPSAV
jgi:cyclopropane-fatty-acyl-phospholipid synthase